MAPPLTRLQRNFQLDWHSNAQHISVRTFVPRPAFRSLRRLRPFGTFEHIRAVIDGLFLVRGFCLLALVEA